MLPDGSRADVGEKSIAVSRRIGHVVFVVGPSGAGKDTLLARSRVRLIDEPRVRFVQRVVTRPAGLDENNTYLSDEAFAAAKAAGRFALTWDAHGLHYGVPLAVLEAAAQGAVMVCNGSRGALPVARAVFQNLKVVLVTAPRSLRAERLRARGREPETDARLDRMPETSLELVADLTIDNSGEPEVGEQQLTEYLRALAKI